MSVKIISRDGGLVLGCTSVAEDLSALPKTTEAMTALAGVPTPLDDWAMAIFRDDAKVYVFDGSDGQWHEFGGAAV